MWRMALVPSLLIWENSEAHALHCFQNSPAGLGSRYPCCSCALTGFLPSLAHDPVPQLEFPGSQSLPPKLCALNPCLRICFCGHLSQDNIQTPLGECQWLAAVVVVCSGGISFWGEFGDHGGQMACCRSVAGPQPLAAPRQPPLGSHHGRLSWVSLAKD